jgi:hypothetical protein
VFFFFFLIWHGVKQSGPAQRHRKRCRLSSPPTPVRRVSAVPRPSQLSIGPPAFSAVPPPPHVLAKLARSAVAIGFDVETHDWAERTPTKVSVGAHGFYNICRPCDLESRVVQLGWAIIDATTGAGATTEQIIRPCGFTVSEKAARYHGITQIEAEELGNTAATVLTHFMDDVRAAVGRGGRLVAHHIEPAPQLSLARVFGKCFATALFVAPRRRFDAGILAREMHRAGLDDCAAEWSSLVREHGYCTMCPQLGRWLCRCFGRDEGPETVRNCLRLRDMASWLLPAVSPAPAKFHTAGFDARVHALVFLAVASRAGACSPAAAQ